MWGAERLSVRIGGREVLHAISLDVPGRAVTAVVGGDGAGKTTLLRALVGARRVSGGVVRRPPAARIGYVSAGPGVYSDLTVDENLAFAAAAYHVGGDELRQRRDDLLRRTGLNAARTRPAAQLSGGMRQKLALAMALLHQPDLVVLDEPTTGVDPTSRAELWRIIAATAAAGAAVVLATTYLDEAERASSVLVLDEGRALVSGDPDAVVAAMPGAVVESPVRLDGDRSWRFGAAWRAWRPGGDVPAGARLVTPRLEDAVIVAALGATREHAA